MIIFILGFCAISLPSSFSYPYVANDTLKDLKDLRTKDLKELHADIDAIQTKISDIEHDISEGKWKKFGGHCYLFSEHRTNWPDAVRMCQQMGGYLVKVDGAAEDKFLGSEMSGTSWLGLSDMIDKQFRWIVDQQPATYKHFASGKPSLGGPGCVYKNNSNKFWYDYLCTPNYKYICEHDRCD